VNTLNYRVINKNNNKYIEFASDLRKLSSEQDIVDCISICMENDVYTIILHSNILSEDFFNLKTGLAGMALQKFINYNVKVAVIIKEVEKLNERFKEMIMEANKGNHFRTFRNIGDAEIWISNL
jgi:predicted nucleotidyltransferase